jgi:hypothetical protein
MDVGGGKVSRNNIPSREDFARAKAAMKKLDHGLSHVRDQILARFHERGLHEIFVLYSRPTNTFMAYVFYRLDNDIVHGDESGLSAEIRDAVYKELAAAGRGKQDTLNVRFEYDSHENVERNYQGDYFNRLR